MWGKDRQNCTLRATAARPRVFLSRQMRTAAPEIRVSITSAPDDSKAPGTAARGTCNKLICSSATSENNVFSLSGSRSSTSSCSRAVLIKKSKNASSLMGSTFVGSLASSYLNARQAPTRHDEIHEKHLPEHVAVQLGTQPAQQRQTPLNREYGLTQPRLARLLASTLLVFVSKKRQL